MTQFNYVTYYLKSFMKNSSKMFTDKILGLLLLLRSLANI